MTAEQKARQKIDRLLAESGWIVQDRRGLNPERPVKGDSGILSR